MRYCLLDTTEHTLYFFIYFGYFSNWTNLSSPVILILKITILPKEGNTGVKNCLPVKSIPNKRQSCKQCQIHSSGIVFKPLLSLMWTACLLYKNLEKQVVVSSYPHTQHIPQVYVNTQFLLIYSLIQATIQKVGLFFQFFQCLCKYTLRTSTSFCSMRIKNIAACLTQTTFILITE